MKRKSIFSIFAICLTVVFCGIIFTACGKNSPTTEEPALSYSLNINKDLFCTEYRIGQNFAMASASKKIPIATCSANNVVVYDTDDFEIEDFDTTSPGNKTLKIKYNDYVGYLEYSVKESPIKEISTTYNRNEYIIGEDINKLWLDIFYEDGYGTCGSFELENALDTKTSGNKIYEFEYLGKNVRFEYAVYNYSSVKLADIFLKEYPLGFEYDFSKGTVSVDYVIDDNKSITRSLDAQGVISCDSVGKKTTNIVCGDLQFPFEYEVLDIDSIALSNKNNNTFSVLDKPDKLLYLDITMSNGKKFDYSTIDISNLDISTTGEFSTKVKYLNYEFDFDYEVVGIDSISVDGLGWEDVYYLGEDFKKEINPDKIVYIKQEERQENINDYTIALSSQRLRYLKNVDYSSLFNSDVILYTDSTTDPDIQPLENYKSVYQNVVINRESGNIIIVETTENIVHHNTDWFNPTQIIINPIYVSLIENLSLNLDFYSISLIYLSWLNISIDEYYSLPVNVKLSNGQTIKEYVNVDDLSIEGFDSSKIGEKQLSITYLGKTATHDYKVKEIKSVSVDNNQIYSGNDYKNTDLKVCVLATDNTTDYFDISTNTILETSNKLVGVFYCGDNYYFYKIDKIGISNISQDEDVKFSYLTNVDGVEINVLYEDGLLQTKYINVLIDTTKIGKSQINLNFGGVDFVYQYEVVGVKNYYIKDEYLTYTVGDYLKDIEIVFELSDGTTETKTHSFEEEYLVNPGLFSKGFELTFNGIVYNIDYNYEVLETPIKQIAVNYSSTKSKFIIGETSNKLVHLNTYLENGEFDSVKGVWVEIDTESIGLKQCEVNAFGLTCMFDYEIIDIENISFIDNSKRIYLLDDNMQTIYLEIKSGNLSYTQYITRSTNNPNIIVSEFNTSTIGIKTLDISYYGKELKYTYCVGEVKQLEIINNNQRIIKNANESVLLEIKATLSLDYNTQDTIDLYFTENIGNRYFDFSQIGTYEFKFRVDNFELTFNYTVYEIQSIIVQDVVDKKYYVGENNTADVNIKLIYSDGVEEVQQKSIELGSKNVGEHTEILDLGNGYSYVYNYTILGIKNYNVTYSYQLDYLYSKSIPTNLNNIDQHLYSSFNRYYYFLKDKEIKGITLDVVFDDDTLKTITIDRVFPNNQIGEHNEQFDYYGELLNFSYYVCEVDIVEITSSTKYFVVGQTQKASLNIRLKINDELSCVDSCLVDICPENLGENTLTFEYEGQELTFKYNAFSIENIEVLSYDTILLNYSYGTTATVQITYSNGESNTESLYINVDSSNLGTKTKVVSYLGSSFVFEYEVVEIVDIELENVKIEFNQNDPFEINQKVYVGLENGSHWDLLYSKLIIIYSNGKEETINMPTYSTSYFDMYWYGTKDVGEFNLDLFYKGFEKQFTYYVK